MRFDSRNRDSRKDLRAWPKLAMLPKTMITKPFLSLTIAATITAPMLAGCSETHEQSDAHRPSESKSAVSDNTLLPAAPDFAHTRIGADTYPIPKYAKFLEGLRICLDPGHGGDAHKPGYKRGPTGVREAEMNLRVARYLREFLTHAGAQVRLTRDDDVDLSLKERADIANSWLADIFISLHHNAIANKPTTNYTTVWYHGDINDHPASVDLARYLCQGLLDELDVDQHAGVPLKSDQLMYASGFAVLRHAKVTAALCESSFYTHPQEEQRLRNPEYNLREAYGIFLGLARYAAGGLPAVGIPQDSTGASLLPNDGSVVLQLDDGLRSRKAWGYQRNKILLDSISVKLNDSPLPFEFDSTRYLLKVTLPPDLKNGGHTLRVHFENMYKNSVLNPMVTINIPNDEGPA